MLVGIVHWWPVPVSVGGLYVSHPCFMFLWGQGLPTGLKLGEIYSKNEFMEYWEHMMSLVFVKVRFSSFKVIRLNKKTRLICRLVIALRLESILSSSISRRAGQSKIETWWVHSFFQFIELTGGNVVGARSRVVWYLKHKHEGVLNWVVFY
jgi:hypothetical protein